MHRTSEFDYALPVELIAQEPLADRSASRLLVLERASGAVTHRRFTDLTGLIRPEDVVVLNTSKVIPARLHGIRDVGSGVWGVGKNTEILLVRDLKDGTWTAMGHPGGKLKPGRRVVFGDDSAVEILEVLGGGLRRIRFVGALDARATLARYGEVPLPPYIKRAPTAADRERYQTVYAAHEGSVAAPTAGLHFTPPQLDDIKRKGTAIATVDLHIGPGTFKPHGGPNPGNGGRRGGARAGGGWRDAPLHLSSLPLPRGGPAADQLPPAAVHTADAGVRLRRVRGSNGGVR